MVITVIPVRDDGGLEKDEDRKKLQIWDILEVKKNR